MVETALWALPAALVSTTATMLAAAVIAPGQADEILVGALRSVDVAAPAAVLGSLLGGCMTCEMDLFRYFKER